MALRRSHRIGPPPGRKVPRHRFPPPGEFIIYSSPVFVVTRGGSQEVITFAATMRVRAGTTTKTAAGSRVVDIEMLEWEAVGKSNLLGGEVRYSLLKGLKSPPAEGDLFDISGSEVKLGDVTIRGIACRCSTPREL